MAEIAKWGASQVLPIIRHNLRRLEDGNSHGNQSIQPELTCQNYGLVYRGDTCKEINAYRKQIESSCYKYNRKDLVRAIEVVIQCPSDCPDEQKEKFFEGCFGYVCSKLPMGEICVFVAEVHLDEKHFAPDGMLLSKGHIHIMYIPAVPDKKHEKYDYKLCADALTKRSMLKVFHPQLQEYLNQKGIHATVYHPKTGSGKSIGLSIKQLKEITQKTGIRIEKTITTDRFSDILLENLENKSMIKQQQSRIRELESTITATSDRERNNTGWGVSSTWGANSTWGASDSWGKGYRSTDMEVEYDK